MSDYTRKTIRQAEDCYVFKEREPPVVGEQGGITFKIGRSTLADANKRRQEAIFEVIYHDLYASCRHILSSNVSDSRRFYGGQDNTDVLRRFLQPVQQPRKGMGYHSFQGFRCTF